mmetsp:Transcript_18968/g.52923  ORF Transcript_18968/g.52923 Transcript_18968/m.52923 type:complete len:81 (-) Transcript_18968:1473-1715(-)
MQSVYLCSNRPNLQAEEGVQAKQCSRATVRCQNSGNHTSDPSPNPGPNPGPIPGPTASPKTSTGTSATSPRDLSSYQRTN